MFSCLVAAAEQSTVKRQPPPEPLDISYVNSVYHDPSAVFSKV